MPDLMKSLKNKEVHEIKIESELILNCKAAHSKYKIDLEDAVSSSTNDEKFCKREMIHNEIEGIKHQKVEIEACVKSLTKDVNTYYDRTENDSDMSLLNKANAIRKSISSKQELVKNVNLATKKLEEERRHESNITVVKDSVIFCFSPFVLFVCLFVLHDCILDCLNSFIY